MPPPAATVFYPESDGLPIAENTVPFDWISLLKWNIDVLFQAREDVFVAGDNFNYPVEGDPKTRLDMIDFVSPLLGVHFVNRDGIVEVYGPDGKLWDTPFGMILEANALVEKAEGRANEAEEKADQVQTKSHRLAEKLRALGLDPEAI